MTLRSDYDDVDLNFGDWLNDSLFEDRGSDTDHSWLFEKMDSTHECVTQGNALLSTEIPMTLSNGEPTDPRPTTVSNMELFPQNFVTVLPPVTSSASPSGSYPELFLTSESRWRAVVDRAPNVPFVYAVLSTKVYCRTTCPARRPLRNNVKFYDTTIEAAEAGFRPCKRCKPDDAAGEAAEQRQVAAVEKAKLLIEEASRRGEKIPLDKLAGEAGLSTFYFHRVFKRRAGVTPEEWGKQCRQRASASTSTVI